MKTSTNGFIVVFGMLFLAVVAWVILPESSAVVAFVSPAVHGDSRTLYMPLVPHTERLIPIGPDGGNVVAIVNDPQNPDTIYAGTWGGGVYRSDDRGLTWRVASRGLSNLYINSLAINPFEPEIVYAGTYRNGVFRTSDGGLSWAPTGPGLNADAIVYTLEVDPLQPEVLYAGTRSPGISPPWGGGVYKSIDSGASWQQKNEGLDEEWVYDLVIDPWNPQVIYAATHSYGVYKTADGAETWKAVNNGLSDLATRTLAIDPTNPSKIFVGTWHGGGVFRTTSNGLSWSNVDAGLSGERIYALQINPLNPDTIYAGTYTKGVMKTTNGAGNWTLAGLYGNFIYSLWVDPELPDAVLAGVSGAGLYRSHNGGIAWGASYTGMKATEISAVAAGQKETQAVYAAVFGRGVLVTHDMGSNWLETNSGLTDFWVHALVVSPGDSRLLYAGTDSDGMFRSTDGGETWQRANFGLPVPSLQGEGDAWRETVIPDYRGFDRFSPERRTDILVDLEVDRVNSGLSVLTIQINPQTPATLYIGLREYGVYKSYNGGTDWTQAGLVHNDVYSVAVDPFEPQVLYAACQGANNGVNKSVDDGGTWVAINNGLAGLVVYSIFADPSTPDLIYAGAATGVYRSEDGGETWEAAGLTGQLVYALAGNSLEMGRVYAGSDKGLYYSDDRGETWKAMNNGLTSLEVQGLDLAASWPQVKLIATKAGGAYLYDR